MLDHSERRKLVKKSPNADHDHSLTANDSDDEDILNDSQLRTVTSTPSGTKRILMTLFVLVLVALSCVAGYIIYQQSQDHSMESAALSSTIVDTNDMYKNNSTPSTFLQLQHLLSVGNLDIDLTQKTTTGPPLLPGIYHMNKAYNLFIGKQIYDQSGVDIIDYQFNHRYTNDISGETYEVPIEFRSIPNVAPSCDIKSTVNDVYYSTSINVLKEQSSRSSEGFEAQFDISLSAGFKVKKVDVTAAMSTTLKFGVMYGDTSTSKQARAQSAHDRTYSFSLETKNKYYQSEILWNGKNDFEFQWKPVFLEAIDELNENASNKSILSFINTWGSHVLTKMQTGSFCTQTTYASSSVQSADVESFQQQVSSFSMDIAYYKKQNEDTSTDASATETETGTNYQTADIYCVGEITVSSTSCAVASTSDKNINNPIVTSYQPLPIWDIQSLSTKFDDETLDNITLFIYHTFAALNDCSSQRCNSHGICTLDTMIWSETFINEWDGFNFNAFWENEDDHTYCFCDEGFYGADCSETELSLCTCHGAADCCCTGTACDVGNLCSSKVDGHLQAKTCIAQSGSDECGAKGDFIQCTEGVVYGVCGSRAGPDCTDHSGVCGPDMYTAIQCGYAGLGTFTSVVNEDWRCNGDARDALSCRDSNYNNHLMIGICGSDSGIDCTAECRGYNGILCASIDGVEVDYNNCVSVYDSGKGDTGNSYNAGELLTCPDGYVGTGLCGSGAGADCKVGEATVNTVVECCKLQYQ